MSERTVSRWLKRANHNPDPVRRWLVLLRNHHDSIAAMDFFTVPTLTFGVLYCFFVIGHDRWKILHCNVTRQPNEGLSVESWRSQMGHRQQFVGHQWDWGRESPWIPQQVRPRR